MSNFYTDDGAGARVVEAKGNILDVITMFGVSEWPLYNALAKMKIQDINPKAVEDTYAAGDTTNFKAQGAAAPAASDTTRAINQNHCQILMETAEVSKTQNAVAQYGMGSELAYQEPLKIKKLMKSFEMFLLSNQASQAATTANSNIGKLAGLGALITTNTSATWSLAVLETTLDTLINTYGSNPSMLYMRGTDKIAVSAWTTTPTRYTTDIKKLTKPVDELETCFGQTLRVVSHYNMPQDIAGAGAPHVLLLDPAHWVIGILRPLERNVLAATGSSEGVWFELEATILSKGEQGSAYWN